MKKIFIIYGHYSDKSFNAAIKDEFINTVKEYIFAGSIIRGLAFLNIFHGSIFHGLTVSNLKVPKVKK